MSIDIRSQAGDPESSLVVSTKKLKENGAASVVVEDEDLQDSTASLVLLKSDGEMVIEVKTVIGGEK